MIMHYPLSERVHLRKRKCTFTFLCLTRDVFKHINRWLGETKKALLGSNLSRDNLTSHTGKMELSLTAFPATIMPLKIPEKKYAGLGDNYPDTYRSDPIARLRC